MRTHEKHASHVDKDCRISLSLCISQCLQNKTHFKSFQRVLRDILFCCTYYCSFNSIIAIDYKLSGKNYFVVKSQTYNIMRTSKLRGLSSVCLTSAFFFFNQPRKFHWWWLIRSVLKTIEINTTFYGELVKWILLEFRTSEALYREHSYRKIHLGDLWKT